MLSRVPSPRARVRFAASRPCPGRRGRGVAGRRGRGGGVLLPPLVGVRWSPRFSGLACGGVSWLLCLAWSVSFRWFPWRCVRPAVGSRRGAVPPWVCRSAVRVARCPGSSRSRGFPLSLPLRASRCRGVGGFPLAPAFAPCARFPVGLRCRFPFAGACRRAGRGCGVCWRLARLSRAFSLPVPVRRPGGGRVFRFAPAFAPLVAGVVASVLAAGRSVAVGCAAGADSFARAAAPGALVFSAAAFGSGRGAFAARSVALVRAVAAGGPGSGFVVFPGAPCPAGLSPSARSSACFCGSGSGSWASAAFAVGLGLPLVVFPCGFSALPSWGSWVPAGSGVWAVGFRLVR